MDTDKFIHSRNINLRDGGPVAAESGGLDMPPRAVICKGLGMAAAFGGDVNYSERTSLSRRTARG